MGMLVRILKLSVGKIRFNATSPGRVKRAVGRAECDQLRNFLEGDSINRWPRIKPASGA
jgi:hypothetical protein